MLIQGIPKTVKNNTITSLYNKNGMINQISILRRNNLNSDNDILGLSHTDYTLTLWKLMR